MAPLDLNLANDSFMEGKKKVSKWEKSEIDMDHKKSRRVTRHVHFNLLRFQMRNEQRGRI